MNRKNSSNLYWKKIRSWWETIVISWLLYEKNLHLIHFCILSSQIRIKRCKLLRQPNRPLCDGRNVCVPFKMHESHEYVHQYFSTEIVAWSNHKFSAIFTDKKSFSLHFVTTSQWKVTMPPWSQVHFSKQVVLY